VILLSLGLATGCDDSSPPPSTTGPATTSSPPEPPTTASTSQPTTSRRVIRMANLSEGDRVAHTQEVKGSAVSLEPQINLWIVVQPILSPTYHPQPGPITPGPSGNWTGVAYFGASPTQNAGESFGLIAIAASADVTRAFREYLRRAQTTGSYPGLPSLPPGAVEEMRITVVRN
jgi:hypothetical protein